MTILQAHGFVIGLYSKRQLFKPTAKGYKAAL